MATCWCGRWQFPSFRRALEFINHVAALLEKTDHYPDLIVNYRTVRIEMSTHDVGGLTERDFSLIAEHQRDPDRSLRRCLLRSRHGVTADDQCMPWRSLRSSVRRAWRRSVR